MFPVVLQDVGSTEQLLGSPLPSHPLLLFILTEWNTISHWVDNKHLTKKTVVLYTRDTEAQNFTLW